MYARVSLGLLALGLFADGLAQAPPPQPKKIGPLALSGSLRTRVESWDWFQGDADNAYTFSGSILRVALGRQGAAADWQIETALPLLLGLPDQAVAPGAQGQLGLGATYFVANDRSRHAALPFVKQAFVRLKGVGGEAGSLRLGRTEFVDGMETVPKNPTLAALKRDRIAHRLLGHFGWSHVGRSLDGAQYTFNTARHNLTLLGARPTRGVFQTDGWGALDVAVGYGAYTHPWGGGRRAAEVRLFGLYYHDWRAVLKTDNRPPAARRADPAAIRIGAAGGHYLHAQETSAGTLDFLVWGTLQAGSWGVQDHRAGAISAEAGYQPPGLRRLRPWLRGGFHHGSGDDDPNDGVHRTFFQVLPTPRWLARFPFYNLMNVQDLLAGLVLRPHRRLALRGEFHSLRLAASADLWYQGGGAFQPWTFGYVGRPSNGGRGLANVWDIGTDYTVNSTVSIGGYFAVAQGKSVMQAIYPDGRNARLGYLELSYRF